MWKPVRIALYYNDGTKDIVLSEILETEGVPYCRIQDLSGIDHMNVIIIGERSVRDEEAESLKRYVKRGGILVTLKPKNELSGMFNVTDTGRT